MNLVDTVVVIVQMITTICVMDTLVILITYIRRKTMSYEVWFGQNDRWFGYHSFKHKMDAQRYEERYKKVFPNLTVEIRRRVHASYS